MLVQDADPAAMDPLDFARLVKEAPTGELRALMRGARRAAILDELFRQMPGVFRADRAGALDAVIRWQIGDRPDGEVDTYHLVINGGTCRLVPAPEREPTLTLTIGAVDFLNLVTGNAHPVGLVMRGRLKTRGDLALTAKFPSLFEPPQV